MATEEDYELLINLKGPRGDEGPEGPQGLPSSETLPADDAMAAYVESTGTSATKRALLKNFATVLTPERFGAVGDGVTDNHAALAAMGAAMVNGSRIQGKTGAVYRDSLGMTITGVDGWTWNGGKILYDDATPGVNGTSSGLNIIDCDDFLLDDFSLTVVNQSAQQTGIRVSGSNRGHLRRVKVDNARWVGIAVVGGGYGVVVEDGVALRCRFGAYSTATGAIFRGGFYSSQYTQTAEYAAKGGAWSEPSDYYDGIVIGGANWSVVGATFDDNGQSGIYSAGATQPTVRGCVVTNNHNKGIDFGPTTDATAIVQAIVAANTLAGNKTGNISFVRTINSTITANTVDVGSIGTFALGLHGGCENNLVDGNSMVSSHATAPVVFVSRTPSNGTTAAKNNVFGVNFSRGNVPDDVDWTTNKRVVLA